MRVFAISDLHTDYRDNFAQLQQLSRRDYGGDAVLVAGDVSHSLEVLRRTLDLFLQRFRHVFFVPGNHELWTRNGEGGNSIQKFEAVLRLCESMSVLTGPEVIGRHGNRVSVIPLFSWYTRPGEGSDTLYRERPGDRPSESVWADDYLIKWPQMADFRPAQYFLDLNAARVSAEYPVERISFSHFLPRQDLMFAAPGDGPYAPLDPARARFNFSAVAGSTLIDRQIRQLGSRVHVYGHQHRNRRRSYDGVWYVSNCLGYPEERQGRRFSEPGEILKSVWPVS